MRSCHPKANTYFSPQALGSWRERTFLKASAPFRSQCRRSVRHGQFLAECSGPRHQQTARAVSKEFETLTEQEENVSSFDWFKNWWVVDAVVNLETDRPNKIKLLNRDFIVWKGHSGDWIAMDDECPHRLAPLSEGRIEKDGNLLCSYHAWRFNESGKCVKIPQAEDEKAQSVACNSPRSAVQTYPCKERGALLWIWPDKSTSAFSDSESTSMPIEDDVADYLERLKEEGVDLSSVQRFPFSFDALMENLMDVSHLQVTHHGALPILNRYHAAPIYASLAEKRSEGQRIIFVKYTNTIYQTDSTIEFKAPGTCTFYTNVAEGVSPDRSYMTGTPITATKSLLVLVQLQESQIASKKRPNIIQKVLSPLLSLIYHLFTLRLSDADIAILTKQDLKTKVEGFESDTGYYVPTSADVGVMAFRKWFETEGQRGAAYGGNQPIDPNMQLSRKEAMDRFEQHTKHCKLCSSALKITETVISMLRFVRLAAAFVGSVFLLRVAETGSAPFASILKNVPFIMSVLVLCCSIAAIQLLNKLRAQFYYVGYDFAENN